MPIAGGTPPESSLDKDDAYRAAMSRRPSNYLAFFYLQPKTFAQRLAALRAAVGSTPAPGEGTDARENALHHGFDAVRERKNTIMVLFLGMPKLEHDATLTRSSASLGTKDTFLYLAMLSISGRDGHSRSSGRRLQDKHCLRLSPTAASPGIGKRHSKSSLGRWRIGLQAAHWPSLVVTVL